MQHSCSHANAISNHSLKKRIELRTQEQPLVAKHIEGTNRVRNDPSRNRRTDEVPFIAGCSHFTRKTHGFVLRLPPQHKAHATFMQPCQCDQQPQLQETHRTTHTGTTTCCKTHRRNQSRPERPQPQPPHTAPFIAGCSHFTRKTQGFVLRLPPQNIAHATFMQPLQCDQQPQLQETHGTMNTGTTTCCKTHRRNQSRPGTTPAATAAQTRYLSSPAAANLTRKNTRFRAPASPQNIAHATFIHAAIPMRSATTASGNA